MTRLQDLPEHVQAQIRRMDAGTNKIIPKSKPASNHVKKSGKKKPNANEQKLADTVLKGRNPRFEAITFELNGGSRYTPDFCVWDAEKRLTCYEVKGIPLVPTNQRRGLC